MLIPFSTHAFAQTSVALSGYGTFSGTTSGNGTAVSPANQAGGIIEVRHISNAILGFEATYSFNRANQTYTSPAVAYTAGTCPVSDCGTSTETVRGNAHEITLDWVPSIGIGSLRPFGVLGVGALLDVPSQSEVTVTSTGSCPAGVCTGPGVATNTSPTSTSAQAVYVYGAGLDWGLLPHLGLRLQYRGNLYQAPNVTNLFSSANAFTHTAEPMIGAYFNF
jgi:opacity protein-like surface antigen